MMIPHWWKLKAYSQYLFWERWWIYRFGKQEIPLMVLMMTDIIILPIDDDDDILPFYSIVIPVMMTSIVRHSADYTRWKETLMILLVVLWRNDQVGGINGKFIVSCVFIRGKMTMMMIPIDDDWPHYCDYYSMTDDDPVLTTALVEYSWWWRDIDIVIPIIDIILFLISIIIVILMIMYYYWWWYLPLIVMMIFSIVIYW